MAKRIEEIGNRLIGEIEDWSKPVSVFYEKPLIIVTLPRKHKK